MGIAVERGAIHFGPFRVDPKTQRLYRDQIWIKLPRQSFLILQMLLARPGAVVTREELREALWPSDTFVDFDHGLNNAVNRIRVALNDRTESPDYIETLPKVGYRFVGTAHVASHETASDAVEVRIPGELRSPDEQHDPTLVEPREPEPPKLTPPAAWRPSWTTIVVAACAVVVFSLYWFLRPTTSGTRPDRPNWQIESVSALAGLQGDASFSPDGNSIAFCYSEERIDQETEGPHPDIYIKVIGDEKMLRLTNPPGVSFAPAWSPDGKAIAYVHQFEESPGKLAREITLMTSLGGSKHVVRRSGAPRKLAWSPDGKLLAYENDKVDEPSGIFAMSASGSDVRRLTTAPPGSADGYASFSPDGQQIVFVRFRSIYKNDIYIIPVIGGEPRRLTFLTAGVFSPVWTPDGRKIIFSLGGWIAGLHEVSAGDGKRWLTGLYSVPASGGRPERLPLPQVNVFDPAISRAGDKIAFQRWITNMSIWKLPIENTGGLPTKLIASTSMDNGPEFSPDGSRIAFSSLRDGTQSLWSCDAECGNAIRLASLQVGGSAAWSPDSTHIAFDDRASGRSQIYLLGLRDHNAQQITDGDFESYQPAWSADGRSVYFASERTGRTEVWKLLLSTRELVQIRRNAGSFPQESPDGRFVYYYKTGIDDRLKGVWRIPTTGGTEEQIVADADQNFRVRTEGIYYAGYEGKGSKRQPVLKVFSFSTGNTRVVGRLAKPAALIGRNLAITPDGRHALYAQFDLNTSELVLAKGGDW
jgi:Tol biopolymer transport system component/DNA-binding winged helix-turn-helix (wHTH) protein